MTDDIYFTPASDSHKKKEKAKARELKQGSWWKQVVGKGICYHCEQKFKADELTMDHLIPIVRGGTSDKKNCVPSCKECNTKKGYKTRAEMAMDELAKTSPANDNQNHEDEYNNDDQE
ncbi:MAG: HNH endonuclease [Bdellovibrio sp.]|nr:HNH endonuclease [Bdellovibrio sp.]